MSARLWLCAGVVVCAACSPASSQVPEYRIGVLAVLEGPRAVSSGNATVNGAELAVEHVNLDARSGTEGSTRRVRLIVRGYENRPDAAAAAARGLINQDQVDAIVGPQPSAHAIPAARIAEAAGIPMVSPMSTNPETTAGKKFVFRIAYLDDFQGRVIADFARRDLEARTAAVLYDISSTYSRDLAQVFIDCFEEMGGRVVGAETFTSDDADDFREHLETLKSSNPDVVFLPNYSWIAQRQVVQARALGLESTLLGGDTWDMAALATLPSANGVYATHQWSLGVESEEATAFRDSYQAKFDQEPGATAALTYDAVRLLAEAALDVDGDPARVVRHIAGAKDIRGASGTIVRFEGGNPVRGAVVSTITSGHPSVHAVVDPR